MKIAVLSDIHANVTALEACLGAIEAEGADMLLFLGDYITDCPCAAETLSLLRQAAGRFPARFCRGNREDYLLNHWKGAQDGWKPSSRSGALLYTYQQLTEEDLRFLDALPIAGVLQGDRLPLAYCHGSPTNNRELLYIDADNTIAHWHTCGAPALVCGHTHKAYVMERDSGLVCNAGSVGLSTNGEKKAQYAVLEEGEGGWSCSLRAVDYDHTYILEALENTAFRQCAPVFSWMVKKTVETGENWILPCVRRVEALAREQGGNMDDEKLWERAAEELCQ